MSQLFKGDSSEMQFYESGLPIMEELSLQKQLFFDDAYACHILGELLYDSNRMPLANAIPRVIFRESFDAVIDAFLVSGSFESYLTVFRKIFGDDVEVDFTVLAPGKLQIDITATQIELYDFVARTIVDNAYVFDEIIDDEGDNIAFQTIKGFQSQYELEQMLFELVPAGIFTDINLTIDV